MTTLTMMAGAAGAMPASAEAANPFAKASPLTFQAPPFDKIHESDYQPALEEGMKVHLDEVNQIADNPAKPTFANTIVAMERSGLMLTRVSKVFFAIAQANTDPTLQKIQSIEAPKLQAHSDAVFLNPKLFARIEAIYGARKALHLRGEDEVLIERYHHDFVHAGAALSEPDKTKLRALNQEEAKLTTEFQTRLLAATKDGALVVSDVKQLDGLSPGDLAAAAQAAKARGLTGKWVLALQNTTQQPYQVTLKNRALRKKLFEASIHRADQKNADDTRAIGQRLAQLRADKAKLLGFANFAAYTLDDQMAKTPEAAIKLMTDLVPAALAKAKSEAQKMQELIDHQGAKITLEPWDWQYYSEQVRKAEYDLDEAELKPYFELDRVLKDGVFYAAHKLYGISFKERHDLPVYQPDVRVFDVIDSNGKPLALFYADYFKRDNKSGGAWMDSFVDQSGLLGTKPVIFNVCNFTKPAPGQPALLSFDDVTTMFHEFGHALHGMFSNVKYPTLAGTNTPRDFVEFPSQFNEHWALDPKVFAHYARHEKTGASMPQALVDKIKKSRTFNQGYGTLEYLEAGLLDMAWHTLSPGAPLQDAASFGPAALKRFGVAYAPVPPRYRSSYFAHIWDGGYAAGYYAYLWSAVLDDDAYEWFQEHGGLTRKNGQRFRDMLLSRGHTGDLAAMYRGFRGRDPSVEALMRDRGLTSPTASK
ncbi:MAG TPA: M3 family metallopeptidase [Polyangia bacterium]